jgi:hypothetical protein
MTKRNPKAACAAMRAAFDANQAERISLEALITEARRTSLAARAFDDDELRELADVAALAGTMPVGVAGEAALAYLLAERGGRPSVPAAIARLEALGGTKRDRDSLLAWVRHLIELMDSAMRQLQALGAARFVQPEQHLPH